jgi:hypothetical protein
LLASWTTCGHVSREHFDLIGLRRLEDKDFFTVHRPSAKISEAQQHVRFGGKTRLKKFLNYFD